MEAKYFNSYRTGTRRQWDRSASGSNRSQWGRTNERNFVDQRERRHYGARRDDNNEEYTVPRAFNKSFTLGTRWPLPNAEEMFAEPKWALNDFQRLKAKLNLTKNKLNTLDSDRWHAHATKMNAAETVVGHVRHHVRSDFPTRAWCEFYEIVSGEPKLIPQDAIEERRASTVHLCEAPRTFVSALNHCLAVNHEDVRLQWSATTLSPYHETNVAASSDGGVCLVTADGCVDCSDTPNEQETVVARLHQTMVALNVLQSGGSLLLKVFTMFECDTICSMYLLCCVFRSVVVKKPATSQPDNSEMYVVCTGYLGRALASPIVRKFFATDGRTRASAAMFPVARVPNGFQQVLYSCAEYFSTLQIATVESYIDALPNRERCYRQLDATKLAMCREFVARCGLRPIRPEQELVPGGRGAGGNVGASDGTCRRLAPDFGREAEALYREARKTRDERGDALERACRGKRADLTVRPSDVRFRRGEPVTAVRSSKFCTEPTLRCRQRALSTFPRPPATAEPSDAHTRATYYRAKYDRHMCVCDVTDVCAVYANDGAGALHRCLQAMTGQLGRMRAGGDLALVGYPLYTQTSVACFVALAKMFETFAFTVPDDRYGYAIVFRNYRRDDDWMDALNAAKRHAASSSESDEHGGHSALVSWLPINVLLEQKAYADIVAFNDLCMARDILLILKSYFDSTAAINKPK